MKKIPSILDTTPADLDRTAAVLAGMIQEHLKELGI